MTEQAAKDMAAELGMIGEVGMAACQRLMNIRGEMLMGMPATEMTTMAKTCTRWREMMAEMLNVCERCGA